MSAAIRMLLGLVAGLLAGTVLSASAPAWSDAAVGIIEPAGTLFINAIRMTVVPLIVSKLVVSLATMSDERTTRSVGVFATVAFVPTVLIATIVAVATVAPVMRQLPIDADVAARLRQDAASSREQVVSTAETLPGIAEWVVALVPINPIGAAADGAMLPLIVFALALGLALARVPLPARETAVQFFVAIGDAMVVLVRWVLAAAPLGVFALAVPLAARLGLAAAGALASYVASVALACVVFAAGVLYPAAVLLGRVPLARFASAAAPAQAIALSSRSSLASLPLMIESARGRLGIPDAVASLFLPLAAALFRPGTAIGTMVAVLFLARLYGVELAVSTLVTVAAVVVVTSFGSPGIPSGGLLMILPILSAAGVPAEGVGILLAVDPVPDMFRTTTNITSHMATVAIVRTRASALEEHRP